MTSRTRLDRRVFLTGAGAAAGTAVAPGWTRRSAHAQAARARPAIASGVQSGDARHDSAVVWSATDRPARMLVEWSTSDRFTDTRQAPTAAALPESGYAAKIVLTG